MDVSRRKELGDFLKKSRGRRKPADAGLPAGPRRRTPGLRREEVAHLAGLGPTWYTWLEQGREITVSPRALDAIATALGLTRSERDHLFRLADILPGSGAIDTRSAEVPVLARAMVRQLDPFLACVYNVTYDVLVCNDAYAACFPELAEGSAGERNLLHHFAGLPTDQAAAHENLIGAMIGRFRANYSANLNDPRWRSLVENVILRNELMRALWTDHVVKDAADSVDRVRTRVGDITFLSASFAMAANPELNILVGKPKTDEDQRLLKTLLEAGPGRGDRERE